MTSSLPGDEAKQLPPESKCLLDSGGVQSHSRESTCLLCENGMPAESPPRFELPVAQPAAGSKRTFKLRSCPNQDSWVWSVSP